MAIGRPKKTPPTFVEALTTLAVKNGSYTLYDMLDIMGFTEKVLNTFPEDAETVKVLLLGMQKLHEIVIPQKELNSYTPSKLLRHWKHL